MTKQQEDFLEHTQKQIAFCDTEIDNISRKIRDVESCQSFSDYLLENEGNGAASDIAGDLLWQIELRDSMIEQLRYKLYSTESILELYRTTQ